MTEGQLANFLLWYLIGAVVGGVGGAFIFVYLMKKEII